MEWRSAIKQRGERDPSRSWNWGDSEHSITVSCAILGLALHSADTHGLSKMQICLDLVRAYPAPPLGSPDWVAHSQFTMCSKRIFRTRSSPGFSMVGFLDSHTLWWRRGSFVHISMLTQLELCKQPTLREDKSPPSPIQATDFCWDCIWRSDLWSLWSTLTALSSCQGITRPVRGPWSQLGGSCANKAVDHVDSDSMWIHGISLWSVFKKEH